MKFRVCAAVWPCLLAGACAGPLDRPWDGGSFNADRGGPSVFGEWSRGPRDVVADGAASGVEGLDTLSVEDAIRAAIMIHPRLRAAAHRVEASSGRATQAGLYPNPSLVFDAESLGADAGSGGETIYRIEQEIVLGGRLADAREVADADRMGAEAELRGEEFVVASRVTRAYFACVAAEARLAQRRHLADLADDLLGAVTTQFDAGSATEPDRLRAEVVRDQAMIELESSRLAQESARRDLASAIGLGEVTHPLSTKADEIPVLPGLDEAVAQMLRANSRMTAAQISVERARRAHQLARSQAVPDLRASVGPRFSDPDDETTLDVGVGIEIPLFDRNQGAIRGALADRLSAAADLRAVQLELVSEVGRAWSEFEAARSAVAAYRARLLPKADRTLELTRQAYDRGKTDYLHLLDAQQVAVESQIAYVDALLRMQASAALIRELTQSDAPWRDRRIEPADNQEAER